MTYRIQVRILYLRETKDTLYDITATVLSKLSINDEKPFYLTDQKQSYFCIFRLLWKSWGSFYFATKNSFWSLFPILSWSKVLLSKRKRK